MGIVFKAVAKTTETDKPKTFSSSMCFFVIQASHLFRSQCVFTTKKCVFDENFSLSGRLYVQHWAVGASCGRSPGRWDTQPRNEEQEEEK